MAKKWRRVAIAATALVMASSTVVGMTACKKGGIPDANLKKGTYNTYTSVMPSDWNEFTYLDNNDTQIMDYIGSNFFAFDFQFENGNKYNADGTINTSAIVDGGFSIHYSAATAIKDVTSTVDAKWGYTAEQKEDGGYAWEITLRSDLKWDDGTSIDANDFVYSMKEQLNPDFFHTRASTYYNQIMIKNAKEYLYHTSAQVYTKASTLGFTSVDDVIAEYGKENVYMDAWDFWGATGYTDEDGAPCPQYLSLTDDTGYDNPHVWSEESDDSDWFTAALVFQYYSAYFETSDLYVLVDNENTDVDTFDKVGLYANGNDKLVICLDSPIQCLKNGELYYLAPYMLSSLPLVKEDLYEKCKIAPVTGSTLWTTNYNSSYETTASWGPYKLTSFQSGKSYTLERNEYWYGYGMEEYANQYNVTKINCEKITEEESAWMAFWNGTIDAIGLDVDHAADYKNSKYTYYAAGSGVFGTNIYSDLNGLKRSGHNSGILAIDDFRKAIGLYLNRNEYNATLSTSNQTCLGLINLVSLYDVENGLAYSNTQQSKEALLRVYGFTQNDDGTWTDGTNTYSDYLDAAEAMTGYNPTQAKALVNSAYETLVANAEYYGYDAGKKITITFGTSTDNAATRRYYNYYVEFFANLTKDTPLEGKIEVVFDASFGSSWANSFKNGEYELAAGTGFSGSPLDPYNFIGVYIDPTAGLMYSTWWDTESEMLSITLPTVSGFAQSGETIEMSIYNWYCCLNGTAEANGQTETYNWGAGFADSEVRLAILAKLEEVILGKYYTIQTTSQYSASMLGAQFSYLIDEDNYFMGFGGIRYMTVNYTDDEWEAFVASKNNTLKDFYKSED